MSRINDLLLKVVERFGIEFSKVHLRSSFVNRFNSDDLSF
jgi:hypothetical protein